MRTTDYPWPRLAFACTMVATFIAACLPSDEAPTLGGSDKVNHVVAFTVLAVMAAWAFPRLRLATIFIGLAFFGAAIEVTQMIPALGRDAEWADLRADCAAIAISLALVALFRTMTRRGL